MRPRCGLGAASGLREARAQPLQEALLEDIENPIFQISVFDEQLVTVLVVEHHFFKISCLILYAKRTPERHRKDPLSRCGYCALNMCTLYTLVNIVSSF